MHIFLGALRVNRVGYLGSPLILICTVFKTGYIQIKFNDLHYPCPYIPSCMNFSLMRWPRAGASVSHWHISSYLCGFILWIKALWILIFIHIRKQLIWIYTVFKIGYRIYKLCALCAGYRKCSKILNFSLSVFKENMGYQGWSSQKDCQNSKQGRPWSDCFFRSSLIWVCAVCLGLFG